MKSLILLFTGGLILLLAACTATGEVEPASGDLLEVATVVARPSATPISLQETRTPPPTPLATMTPTWTASATHTPTVDPTVLTTTPWPPDPIPSPTPVPPFPGMVYTTDEGLWRINADWQPELLFDRPGVLEPNGRRLLYGQDGDIWLADPATGTNQNLTNTPDENEYDPQWRSGKNDSFLIVKRHPEDPDFRWQMLLVSLEGDYEVLTTSRLTTWPDISPDGTTIAFDIDGNPALYHENGVVEELFFDSQELPSVKFVGKPVWSPDGERIAWLAYLENPTTGQSYEGVVIYERNPPNNFVLHSYVPLGSDTWGDEAVWSPDGEFVTFFAIDIEESGFGLWVMSNDRAFQMNLGVKEHPIWSPDGRYLLYQSDESYFLTVPPDFTAKINIYLPPGARVLDWQELP